jgi:hypothetical protein
LLRGVLRYLQFIEDPRQIADRTDAKLFQVWLLRRLQFATIAGSRLKGAS